MNHPLSHCLKCNMIPNTTHSILLCYTYTHAHDTCMCVYDLSVLYHWTIIRPADLIHHSVPLKPSYIYHHYGSMKSCIRLGRAYYKSFIEVHTNVYDLMNPLYYRTVHTTEVFCCTRNRFLSPHMFITYLHGEVCPGGMNPIGRLSSAHAQ